VTMLKRTDEQGSPLPKVSESKVGAWIAWAFAVVLGAVYLYRLFTDGAPVLPWKTFAILDGGAIAAGLVLFTAPGDAVDLLFDAIRKRENA